jgi:hypothetical protein
MDRFDCIYASVFQSFVVTQCCYKFLYLKVLFTLGYSLILSHKYFLIISIMYDEGVLY